MSYEHLAGRIVEIQRSMVGRPAITIGQSIEGLSVTDDGNVESIGENPCVTLDALVEAYTDMLGDPAATRFETAAAEFQSELDLPASLGGDPGADEATSIEITSPEGTDHDSDRNPSKLSKTIRETGNEPIDGTLIVQYTLQDGQSLRADADLHSVYLLSETEDDWQVPVTVADAIESAVASASGSDPDELDDIEEYVKAENVLSTLFADTDAPVCFEVQDLTVTLYSNGTVRVRVP